MLKPFADRYESMRALVETALDFTVANAEKIQALRHAAKTEVRAEWPVHWVMDEAKPSKFHFKGYAAKYSPSRLGNYTRLSYDRNEPWERDIDYFNRFEADVTIRAPRAYVLPQAWREAAERLQWNGVKMERLTEDKLQAVQYYSVCGVTSRPNAYEGHMYHDDVQLEARCGTMPLKAGDWWIPLDQENARYAVETLEPQAHDSFFRWGFFNGVLEKKEAYSDYVFEDHAEELLRTEPELAAAFDKWKEENPSKLSDQTAVLDFIFHNCKRWAEPECRRYPVLSVF